MGDAGKPSITAQNCTATYVNEWSNNGNTSLKIVSNSNNTFYIGITSDYLNIHNSCNGKTIQFIADINTNIPLYLRVFSNINGSWEVQSVLITSTTYDVVLTLDVAVDCTNLWFRIDSTKGYDDVTVYTDNWRLFLLDE